MTIEKEPLPAGTSPGRGRIVVGVDGSPGSLAAMRWALSEASWRGADVHAIGAWTYPGGRGSGVSAADGPSPGDVLAKAMEATIAAATAPTSGGAAPPVVTVIVSVVHGDPAWELPTGSGEGDETPDPVEPVGSPCLPPKWCAANTDTAAPPPEIAQWRWDVGVGERRVGQFGRPIIETGNRQ